MKLINSFHGDDILVYKEDDFKFYFRENGYNYSIKVLYALKDDASTSKSILENGQSYFYFQGIMGKTTTELFERLETSKNVK